MAKPWNEVAASPQYQALDSDQREAAKRQYFDTQIIPNVPAEQQETVRNQFLAHADTLDTLAATEKAKAGLGSLLTSGPVQTAGVVLPLAAAGLSGGMTAIPAVAGRMALGLGAGALTEKAAEASGLSGLAAQGAQKIREIARPGQEQYAAFQREHPIVAGSLRGLLGPAGAISPIAYPEITATAVENIPAIASMLVGAKVAGAKLPGKRVAVPHGQEAAEMLKFAEREIGTPPPPTVAPPVEQPTGMRALLQPVTSRLESAITGQAPTPPTISSQMQPSVLGERLTPLGEDVQESFQALKDVSKAPPAKVKAASRSALRGALTSMDVPATLEQRPAPSGLKPPEPAKVLFGPSGEVASVMPADVPKRTYLKFMTDDMPEGFQAVASRASSKPPKSLDEVRALQQAFQMAADKTSIPKEAELLSRAENNLDKVLTAFAPAGTDTQLGYAAAKQKYNGMKQLAALLEKARDPKTGDIAPNRAWKLWRDTDYRFKTSAWSDDQIRVMDNMLRPGPFRGLASKVLEVFSHKAGGYPARAGVSEALEPSERGGRMYMPQTAPYAQGLQRAASLGAGLLGLPNLQQPTQPQR